MATKKIDFAQPLLNLSGQHIRRDVLCHSQTVAKFNVVLRETLKDRAEVNNELVAAINKAFGEPLTLQEAICDSMTMVHVDENGKPERLSGTQRADRIKMAIKCNKRGMVKITSDDIEVIMPVVEKTFLEPLITVQIKMLLRGEAFALTAEDDDDKVVPIKDTGVNQGRVG